MEGLAEKRAQQGRGGPHFGAIQGKTEKATADVDHTVTGKGGDERTTTEKGCICEAPSRRAKDQST